MKRFLTILLLGSSLFTFTACSSSPYPSNENRILAGTLLGGGAGAAAYSDRPLAGGVAGAAIGAIIGFLSGGS